MRRPWSNRAPAYTRAGGGRLLVREIEGSGDRDAVGQYPVFACEHWPGLVDDLEALEGELVSVVLVTDPFGEWTVELLDATFPDHRVPFKEHFRRRTGSRPWHAGEHSSAVRRPR